MRKDGRETRQNIIEKSLQIFSVKGYYNTSISDIMAATGLTKGGLYSHFDSKEALWNAAYERAVEIWKGIVFKRVADFIVISINGAAALYVATRDNRFPRASERQLNAYIRTLRV
jgi:AcrR family transcriptional regulator